MSSPPQSSPTERAAESYLLVHNHYVSESTVSEIDLANNQSWMVATVIEDDDLMFGGKPLSAWYEEERTRQSMAYAEEEKRGRQRERPRYHDGKQKHHHSSKTKSSKH